MLFNSHEFVIFLSIAFIVYWLLLSKSFKLQNAFLLVASYVFYGWWDYRFLSLIVLSSIIDYFCALAIAGTEDNLKRKVHLALSLIVNLGLLGVFKYYNFFVHELQYGLSMLGLRINTWSLSIILPVGISFYTFQTLSYTIDVYRKKMKPTKDIIAFFTYVSFFPQLVAGPIERASALLPQFFHSRRFDPKAASAGLRQILWGLVKKVVIADGSARLANIVFSDFSHLPSSTILIGVVFFAFQIYGDFSGYSDIAIGTAKLFGFSLTRNFSFPYFSRDIAEFWRRWHISLSSWFRDYLYIPLGGSKGTKLQTIRNTMVIFLVSGLWHGANWTFIAWGLLNAVFFLPYLLAEKNRVNMGIVAQGRLFPSLLEVLSMLFTFMLTCIAWIFFRSDSIVDALAMVSRLLDKSLLTKPTLVGTRFPLIITLFIATEWAQRHKGCPLELGGTRLAKLRWPIYYICAFLVFYYFNYQQTFIYFQF